jgi:hypothetical protein
VGVVAGWVRTSEGGQGPGHDVDRHTARADRKSRPGRRPIGRYNGGPSTTQEFASTSFARIRLHRSQPARRLSLKSCIWQRRTLLLFLFAPIYSLIAHTFVGTLEPATTGEPTPPATGLRSRRATLPNLYFVPTACPVPTRLRLRCAVHHQHHHHHHLRWSRSVCPDEPDLGRRARSSRSRLPQSGLSPLFHLSGSSSSSGSPSSSSPITRSHQSPPPRIRRVVDARLPSCFLRCQQEAPARRTSLTITRWARDSRSRLCFSRGPARRLVSLADRPARCQSTHPAGDPSSARAGVLAALLR